MDKWVAIDTNVFYEYFNHPETGIGENSQIDKPKLIRYLDSVAAKNKLIVDTSVLIEASVRLAELGFYSLIRELFRFIQTKQVQIQLVPFFSIKIKKIKELIRLVDRKPDNYFRKQIFYSKSFLPQKIESELLFAYSLIMQIGLPYGHVYCLSKDRPEPIPVLYSIIKDQEESLSGVFCSIENKKKLAEAYKNKNEKHVFCEICSDELNFFLSIQMMILDDYCEEKELFVTKSAIAQYSQKIDRIRQQKHGQPPLVAIKNIAPLKTCVLNMILYYEAHFMQNISNIQEPLSKKSLQLNKFLAFRFKKC